MNLIKQIKEAAKKNNKRIVLPEGEEVRTLTAADILVKEGITQVKLIGNPTSIKNKARELNLKNIDGAIIIDPLNHEKKKLYIDKMVEIRREKGLSKEEAEELIKNPLYLGALMIKCGDADGEVAGAMNFTGNVLRPAFTQCELFMAKAKDQKITCQY